MADAEPKKIKIFNLTDIATDNLTRGGLVDQHIAIVDRMCAPGEFIEVVDGPYVRATVQHLVQVGALSVDQLPPPYVQARQLRESSSSKRTAALPHLDVKETKVAEDAPVPEAEVAVAVTTKDSTGKNKGK